ncbi:MAG: DUF4176 domain-containing protein [Lachnospiraceae bacterium]|nr:DUF4176 domain-containing protein [Lachnospiraceae bacterium]
MENNTYLPIGSIVLLEGQKKRVMIVGRRVMSGTEGVEYDYQGCMYPEGAMGNKDVILFNNTDINMIYFIGFQDIEELAYRKIVLNDSDAKSQKG